MSDKVKGGIVATGLVLGFGISASAAFFTDGLWQARAVGFSTASAMWITAMVYFNSLDVDIE